MANWSGSARSNYVRIKDMQGLATALDPFPIRISPDDDAPDLVCFLSEECDSGGWPSSATVDPEEDDSLAEPTVIDFDPLVQICPFMASGQILVMMEAGAQRMRYITGRTLAFDCEGRSLSVDLADIYARAAAEFGVPLASITDASD